ncbi:unnamed protein product [Caenorhabditis bovis]|uniref:RING-type E3 ubiquitin transferase n=1 Tax=Caenorhabditis bovis TaxID=2654633 RepID=A0A8S1FB26_9PELO|nr:unnamed protein product [Caenorhabditis bovis]
MDDELQPPDSGGVEVQSASTSADPDADSAPSEPDDLLMCRVCRGNDGELYYPCLCTGSIKYVHQECLVQWLKYSKKEKCELCSHKYSFQPIYRPDMPKILPIFEIAKGIVVTLAVMLKTWIIYTLVMMAWLGLVPFTAARIYNFIFYLSFQDIISSPFQLIKVEHVAHDVFKGCILLIIFVCTFISLVWLREQIILGGPQNFLNIDNADEEENEQRPARNDDDGLGGPFDDDSSDEDDEVYGEYMDGRYENADDSQSDDQDDEEVEDENGNVDDNRMMPNPDMMDDADEMDRLERRRQRRRRQRQRDRENANQDQEDNWRDWDRLGEDLTWQRLLGLDGSLIFLEHVFWVISLNTIFTVTFAYIPYRFGHHVLSQLGLYSKIAYFPSITSMLCGYVIIASLTYVAHACVGAMRMKSLYRFLGIMFLIIKVFLLVLIEIGLFPVMCGCWMDVCTLPLFQATLNQRIATFAASPFMSIFLHWMIGMVYVFYSASFVILLREILRPGVLWFMRNLNDPDFNPIQEMIDLPFTRHLRRLVVSTTLFFTTILLIFYIPLTIMTKMAPTVLPYNVSMSADTPLSELSLELLILQIVLPAVLEHAHGRTVIKFVVTKWCYFVGKLLDLDRYLLSDNSANANRPVQPPAAGAGGGLAAEHQALLLLREPRAYEPYVRPAFFAVRIAALLVFMAITTILTSLSAFIVPPIIGRYVVYALSRQTNVHEIYTTGIGFYVLWLVGKLAVVVVKFARSDENDMKTLVWKYTSFSVRAFAACIPISVVLPFVIGTLFQYIFLIPLRLTQNQTALSFPYQDWAMGVLQMKIIAVVIMMGPESWLKTEIEVVINGGIDNFNATRTLFRLTIPVMLYIGSCLAFPVVLCAVYATLTGLSYESQQTMLRYSYPTFMIILMAVCFLQWQMNKLNELAERIKNDRYLVGTQLVNYEKNVNSDTVVVAKS